MPYNEELAMRVLTTIGAEPSLVQKRMFGGMAYMLQGNLACCVLNDDLIVRVPKDEYAAMCWSRSTSARWTTPAEPCAVGSSSAPARLTATPPLAEWVGYGASTALALPPK